MDLELLLATVRHGRKGNLWFRQRLVGSALWRGHSTVNLLQVPIIIIIIILGISFMQSIYTYIPETNHVPREHCVATILM